MDLTNHRKFYVNDKLEFALFYDKKVKDKDTIINTFIESKDWKSFVNYCKFNLTDIRVSKDLSEVFVTGTFK